ncbi:MAG: hypothetical protein F2521_03325 [Actinobacteria bacterium]|uniref:Unannotated protein n=1 Tax=freshwater metagenome TaxID=449393 RepID=A0A6J6B4Q6_9ZZZZ|nr:hypothetical protein [Actinomycetota bacterium]
MRTFMFSISRPKKTFAIVSSNQRAAPASSIHKCGSNFLQLSRKEDGNVESALVLIPMLILFLIGVQLIVATNIRNIEMALAQGDASARAISHQYQSGDEVLEVGGRIEKIQILVTHRTRTLPQLVPGLAVLMGGNPESDVLGIAVIEPTNP